MNHGLHIALSSVITASTLLANMRLNVNYYQLQPHTLNKFSMRAPSNIDFSYDKSKQLEQSYVH